MKPKKDQADLSGIFGESVSFRKVNGRVVAKIRRKRNMDNPTKNQIAFKEKFRVAAAWASKHVEDEKNEAFYAARITKKRQSPYGLALQDYWKPPQVKSITLRPRSKENVENVIDIEAIDRFMVTKVIVVITDFSGNLIEEGEAVMSKENSSAWHYVLTVPGTTMKGTRIVATAFDRPGHTGTLEVVL